MSPLKIARDMYRGATQTDLVAFTENVLQRTSGPAYESLQNQREPLTGLLADYYTKLTAALNRGTAEMLARKNAQLALLEQLDTFATALETLAKQNEHLIVEAGFRVHKSRNLRTDVELPVPLILRAISTGLKGQIQVVVDDQTDARKVATHAFEYSTDREHWTNGTYCSRRKFKVSGLPRAQDVWVRLRSLGYNERRSEWTEPTLVAVL